VYAGDAAIKLFDEVIGKVSVVARVLLVFINVRVTCIIDAPPPILSGLFIQEFVIPFPATQFDTVAVIVMAGLVGDTTE
jgi:hypothetical protein